MIKLDLKHCTGCEACVQICPNKCISMEDIGNGFIFPHVDKAECINCSRCDKVCLITRQTADVKPKAYAAVNKKKSSLLMESSGGVFDAIARYVLNTEGVVYGCAFTRHLKAEHIRVDRDEYLPLLYGSKYVQSKINDTFMSVKKDLNACRMVVFSGTPCQVAGLKSYLGKNYDNLITIDIVCHGVPSQAYFDKYINWLETKKEGKITDYQFRSKFNQGGSYSGKYSYVLNRNKKSIDCRLYYFSHYYYYFFLESSICRECCYSCKYANLQREGDFTLGDLWGAEHFQLDFDTASGCSLLLVNTDKGYQVLEKLNVNKQEIDIGSVVKYNTQLNHPSVKHPLREKRIEDFMNSTAQEIQRDFWEENRLGILKGKLKYMIPAGLAKYIKKIRYRFVK